MGDSFGYFPVSPVHNLAVTFAPTGPAAVPVLSCTSPAVLMEVEGRGGQ